MNVFSKGQRLTSIATALALSFVMTNLTAGGYAENSLKDMPDSWSGLYFGTYFGAGGGNVHVTENNPRSISSLSRNAAGVLIAPSTIRTESNFADMDGHGTGSVAELFVGYNVHKNNSRMIFGGQVEGTVFSDLTNKASGTNANRIVSLNIFTPTQNTVTTSTIDASSRSDLRSMFSIMGRGGFLITSTNMVYGFAGPTEGHFVYPDGADFTTEVKSKWQLGIAAGGGLEHKFNDHWSVRAEYRYIHFNLNTNGTANAPISSQLTTGNAVSVFNTGLSSLDSRSNITFNFGKIGIVYQC